MAGTSYTRQSTIADGNLITASLFNNEYNQIVNAFAYASSGTTGHTHDGSAGQGGNISKMGDQDFLNKIEVDSTNNRIGLYVEVSSAAVEQIRIQDGAIVPVTDSDIDLGTSSLEFKDLYIDGTANIDSLVLASGSTVTAILDEDDLSSDSATSLATQQSIKAYVDAQVTAQDLDFQGDSGGALNIDLDSETLTIAGGTGIDTSGATNTLTVAIDSTVATLTGTQTLTNKTLTAPTISGNLTTDGTIDGRDVATDGTKLDGIETGATADQTAAEIRTLVDSASDSNVFTDADHTKLDGIEAGATADQTAAEIRTLVDSATDSNVFTDADHTKLDGIEANATADQTASEIKTAYESNADTNAFTDADHSKLDGIEASADVTDTTNVTAAGALMDSELTSEASVKAINQGLATSDSPTFTNMTLSGTDSIKVPSGTTAQRNGTPVNGMLRYNSTTAEFEGYQNSAWGALGGGGGLSNVVEDTTPQLGGDLDLNSSDITGTGNINITGNISLSGTVDGRDVATDGTKLDGIEASADVTDTANVTSAGALMTTGGTLTGNLALGDNVKIQVGDEPNLEIYHSGTHSFIEDIGGGSLFIKAGPQLQLMNDGELAVKCQKDSYVKLYHNAIEKLSTESTGVTVTGTVVADGLTVDTSTLHVDATNNRVGVGTTSPVQEFHVKGSGEMARLESTSATGNTWMAFHSPSARIGYFGYGSASDTHLRMVNDTSSGDIIISTNGSERMRIDSSGNVGIGDSTPSATLDVNGAVLLQGGTFTAGIDSGTAGMVLQQDKAIFSRDVNGNYLRNLLKHTSSGDIEIGQSGTAIITAVNISAGSTGPINLISGATGTGGSTLFTVKNNSTERVNTSYLGKTTFTADTSAGHSVVAIKSGTSYSSAILRVENPTTSQSLYMIGNYTSNVQHQAYYGSGSASTVFWTHGQGGESMRLDSSKEVRLSGSTDRGNYRLQVNATGVWAQGAYVNGSDSRWKDDVTTISTNCLDVIKNLRPVTYKYNEDSGVDDLQTKHMGFIAQEVETATSGNEEFSGLISTDKQGYKSMAYQDLIPVLTKAIQEQQEIIEALKLRIEALEG